MSKLVVLRYVFRYHYYHFQIIYVYDYSINFHSFSRI